MPVSAWSLGIVLFLVLPGFLSYRAALARSADPTRRSALWQLSAMLEYTVYIHVMGIALLFVTSWLLTQFFLTELHYKALLTENLAWYFRKYPIEAVFSLFAYLAYVIVAAELLGTFKIPHRVGGTIARVASLPSGKLPLFPQPAPANPEQPVWYEAFHQRTDGFLKGPPQILVKMKSGDWYHGELAAYPILPDDAADKDFLITKARYAAADNPSKIHSLETSNGGGPCY